MRKYQAHSQKAKKIVKGHVAKKAAPAKKAVSARKAAAAYPDRH